MAESKWTWKKVEKLIEAIEDRDIATVEQAIDATGSGALPDRVYDGYWQYGPNSVLAAAIRADDLELFDCLVKHGMKTSELRRGGGYYPGGIDDVLFGSDSPRGKLRSPEMLLKLVSSGFDFSTVDCHSSRALRAFITENAGSIEVFEALEEAGLSYRAAISHGDQGAAFDGCCKWVPSEVIPWEPLLYDGRFDLLDHFISKGYGPASPLLLQVGVKEHNSGQGTPALSRQAIDYLFDKGLPIANIAVVGDIADIEVDAVGYSIIRGVEISNPERLFSSLNYELIETVLSSGMCEMRAEFVGPARSAGRDDLLRLYEGYGFSSDDVTAEILDQLLAILRNAEADERLFGGGTGNAVKNLEPLRLIQAIDEGETADWRRVTEVLARVYCLPCASGCSDSSTRAAFLNKLSHSRPWTEIFEGCLKRFEGDLDLKLTVPMYRYVYGMRWGYYPMSIGATYWYGQDVGVYVLLASRGVEFSCKTKPAGGRGEEEDPDASPGDVFIWLAPDVSEFIFERNGWDKDALKEPGYWKRSWWGNHERLVPALIGSGNRVAYKWFMENAADAGECKQPSVRELIGSPLLRPFLEDRRDGSVRCKDNVELIMETLRGKFKSDTLLYIAKASLNAREADALRAELQAVKGKGRKKVAEDALALLERLRADDGEIGRKKPTVLQIVTLVMDALDDGDASLLSELEPIAAKVPMTDCVELLEHAAANCDGAAIDRLYEMLAPFECASTALNVALFSGNVQTARALVAHGADLSGELVMVDEKRTPAGKKATREKRYSHGLIGSSYGSSNLPVARDLPEALTKWEGRLTSRTRKRTSQGSERWKLDVNEVSGMKAAETLVAISGERGFEKSIAIRLLWNLISFDGRMTRDSRFDSKSARIVLQAGILSKDDTARLPWSDAISTAFSGMTSCSDVEVVKLVRDFAPPEKYLECWRTRFVQNSELLVIFADTLTAENCRKQAEALRTLAASGEIATLRKLAEKPGWFTKRRVKELIGVSSASGRTEVTAWLLELLNAGKLE